MSWGDVFMLHETDSVLKVGMCDRGLLMEMKQSHLLYLSMFFRFWCCEMQIVSNVTGDQDAANFALVSVESSALKIKS